VILAKDGCFDANFEWSDLTAVIGRKYPTANLEEILESDNLTRDMAITSKLALLIRKICMLADPRAV